MWTCYASHTKFLTRPGIEVSGIDILCKRENIAIRDADHAPKWGDIEVSNIDIETKAEDVDAKAEDLDSAQGACPNFRV